MTDGEPRTGGTETAGWLLRGDRRTFDVDAMLADFGQVYRYPVAPGARADRMEPGQPCFLHLTDTSRVVGIWAIGSVVAPVLELPADDGSDGSAQLYAEVEMFPLRKAIAVDRLRAVEALAGSELFTDPDRANPLVLGRAAVRAIEAFEFELVPPTEAQVQRLEELLDAEDAASEDRPGG